jgi:alkanesulfonate monooxygenase SsuD/methylene tetrahydromethanopterin reductase-like flavin-dependent oxidoreductase (luciferase family)
VSPGPLQIALTDHVEAPAATSADQVYGRVERFVRLADTLGIDYFWFSEHHAHAHQGHLPTPLLLALHLTGRTERIQLGTAIICLNLHHPIDIAEQVAVADHLSRGRMSVGLGSGSSEEEFGYFGAEVTEGEERHSRFEEALRIVLEAWNGEVSDRSGWYNIPRHSPLPLAAPDLRSRAWLAVNSLGSAKIAGRLGFNMMFSHLRTLVQNREYVEAYRGAGGRGLIAANRPLYVGVSDAAAWDDAEPALRKLWRRFQQEGKIAAEVTEPADPRELCAHPINFLLGGPSSVARQIDELRRELAIDVMNFEPHWAGLTEDQVAGTIRRLALEVRPLL